MLDNIITLPVDVLNNGTPVDHAYTRHTSVAGRSVYVAASHVIGWKDMLSFYATENKPSGNFKGVLKVATKFVWDRVVLGVDGTNIVAPIIVHNQASIPVGVTAADMLVARQRNIALQDMDSIMTLLWSQGMT